MDTPVALEPGRDQKTALSCSSPDGFGTVPTVQQDMCQRSLHWLKGPDALNHQLDLTAEGDPFPLADALLPMQLWSERAATVQQDIHALDQTMGLSVVF
jgi:hypothetical protein